MIDNTFWNKFTISYLVLCILIPIILPILNYLIGNEGFGWTWPNSIALFIGMIGIEGVLYSSYKGDSRLKDQIKSSEKNLNEQLTFEKKFIAISSIDYILSQTISSRDFKVYHYAISNLDKPLVISYSNPFTNHVKQTNSDVFNLILEYKKNYHYFYLDKKIKRSLAATQLNIELLHLNNNQTAKKKFALAWLKIFSLRKEVLKVLEENYS